jgi:hypothetical protein
MPKELYLHIGTEKTGSTALQAVSDINRNALIRAGIFYPKTPGERNHVRLTVFAGDGPDTRNLRKLVGLVPDNAYKNFKAHFADELRAEIRDSECSRIFLSNEHLSSRLSSAQEVARLASILRPLADMVKVVVYLRPQSELFLSSYSTAIKAGRIRALEPPTDILDHRYNYEKKLSLWADAFDEANVIVRIYDRNILVGGDVVKDFFSIMGYEPSSDIRIPTNVNSRLDYVALRFLQEFNRHVPLFVKERVNPERGDVANALAKKSMTPALGVPAATLRDIAKLYEKSNAQIARRFLGRSDGKLFEDLKYLDSPDGEALTVEKAVEISAHLWRWKQRQYSKAKREFAALKEKMTSVGKRQ